MEGRSGMEICTMNDFMQSIKPWISEQYIRKAYLDGNGDVVVAFTDGVKNVYRVQDCSRDQLVDILKDMEKQGIDVVL